jgi:uncharacterized membrane protein
MIHEDITCCAKIYTFMHENFIHDGEKLTIHCIFFISVPVNQALRQQCLAEAQVRKGRSLTKNKVSATRLWSSMGESFDKP